MRGRGADLEPWVRFNQLTPILGATPIAGALAR